MSLDISSSQLKEECPLDKSCNWKFLYNSKFNDYNLPIHKCQTCGLETIHPKKLDSLEKLYTEDYYKGTSNYTYIDERETEKYNAYVWNARIHNIKKFVQKGNFLDIGSSFGGFLNRAREFGFSPYGVEISKYASDYCTKRDIPVFQGNFLNSQFDENFFDVITMIEVIEHLESPKLVFEKLYRILKPNGLLVIQTANFDGKQAKQEAENYHYYLPGHLYYYSESNLKSILLDTKFTRFKTYYGVDFSLLAKLLKSRGSFKKLTDYWKWFRISYYHCKSKYIPNSTSSMVLYAWK